MTASAARVIVIGPPGAGKTTVARFLAERLGASHLDTDQLVEQAAGMSVPEIFFTQGEQAFREREVQACREALRTPDAVVSLGGGSVMSADIAEEVATAAARGAQVVFLDVTIAAAAPRLGMSGPRPLLAVNPRAQWTRQMAQRRPTYLALARHVIATDAMTAQEVADAVLDAVSSS